MSDYTIRPVRGLKDLASVQKLQAEVWGFVPLDVVPMRLMRVMERNGSLVLGAFAPDRRLLGFAFGYLGVRDGAVLLCSHMVAVDRDHRDRGIGHALKQAQRDWCLERGYARMVWTFDPLESRNARFNLHKLGCSVGEYWENLYGRVDSGLHAGSATDRFLVDWDLGRPSPDREGCRAPILNPPRRSATGLPDCEDPGPAPADARRLRVLIPRDAQTLKAADRSLVRRWREVTRGVFRDRLRAGYRVVDYDLPRARRYRDYGCYILERQE
jgi:predicted GNAT superfamily acetyltransferase